MNGYIVEEYTELDFEHIVLQSEPVATCEGCGTTHPEVHAGIWTCTECGTVQHWDLI